LRILPPKDAVTDGFSRPLPMPSPLQNDLRLDCYFNALGFAPFAPQGQRFGYGQTHPFGRPRASFAGDTTLVQCHPEPESFRRRMKVKDLRIPCASRRGLRSFTSFRMTAVATPDMEPSPIADFGLPSPGCHCWGGRYRINHDSWVTRAFAMAILDQPSVMVFWRVEELE